MNGRRVFGKSAPSRLSRQMIGVALIAGLIPNAPLIALNQDENENAVVQPTVEATTRTPIAADSAPDEIKRLIKDGKVEVVYDSEPEFVKAGRGWADFHIQLKHTFRYSLTKLKKQGRWQVTLTVTRLDPHIELTHLRPRGSDDDVPAGTPTDKGCYRGARSRRHVGRVVIRSRRMVIGV